MRLLAVLALLALAPAPAWSQVQTHKLLASDGAVTDFFGWRVAITGNTAIIGAHSNDATGVDSGAAYIFNVASGQQLLKLLPSDAEAGDRFGFSVGVSGTTAIVGATGGDGNGSGSGAAYLINTSTGQQIAKLLSSDGESGDKFGYSVAINGTMGIVGAPGVDDNGSTSGAAYVFDTTTGFEVAKLQPNDGAAGDWFGFSVGIWGSTAVVGADLANGNGTDSGAAYVFDALTGQQMFKFTPADGAAGDRLGRTIGLSGNTAIVGSLLDDDNGTDSGSAYLFDVTTGTQIAKLLPGDGAEYRGFGISVAIDGPTAIVGSNDIVNGNNSGSAYVFDLPTGQELFKLLPADGEESDYFGDSVAISGSDVVVGAWHDNDNGAASGSAYLFDIFQSNAGSAFCFGDGSGADCPCGGNGSPGEGCLNSSGTGGAVLTGSGHAAISNDTFQLLVAGVPGNKPGLILRGSNQHAGGQGAPVGDGLLCTTAQTARSQVQITSAGSTSFTDFQGSPFGASSYGSGVPTNYQFWYRDPTNTCSGVGFNFSNAWTVTWLP